MKTKVGVKTTSPVTISFVNSSGVISGSNTMQSVRFQQILHEKDINVNALTNMGHNFLCKLEHMIRMHLWVVYMFLLACQNTFSPPIVYGIDSTLQVDKGGITHKRLSNHICRSI